MVPKLNRRLLDLGKDTKRISGSRAAVQMATVDHILKAFCAAPDKRREVQILADEVGMGKTFVALAVAYTLLDVLRNPRRARQLKDLASCYRCVLVLTPTWSPALAGKWDREDDALLSRCSLNPSRTAWFRSKLCTSPDELLMSIRHAHDLRHRSPPVILVAQTSIFTKKLSHASIRFLLAALFRYWGRGLSMKKRYHIVRGWAAATGAWEWDDLANWTGAGTYDVDLWDWNRHKAYLVANEEQRKKMKDGGRLYSRVGITYDEVRRALVRLNRKGKNRLGELRKKFRKVNVRRPQDARTAGYRTWKKWYNDREDELRDLFKDLWPFLLDKHLPLVIRDEAHHWRNNETCDFRSVRDYVAPHAKRMLLLTATPFQLVRTEVLNILSVADHMKLAIGTERVDALGRLRAELNERMGASVMAGQAFAREWGALADQMCRWKPEVAACTCEMTGEQDARCEALRQYWARIRHGASDSPAEVPDKLRPFFRRALELMRANQNLSRAMRPIMVRHSREMKHRRFWVGREFPPGATPEHRPDRDRLHLASGCPLAPRDELAQYLLMRVVAEMDKGRYRTALGTAFTGCFSTLWASKDGRRANEAAAKSGCKELMAILSKLTGRGGRANDYDHPKLRLVVDEIVSRWEKGEKTLVFCFRVQTAKTLHAILLGQIDRRLSANRLRLLRIRGSAASTRHRQTKAMQQFRRSLTARESSGIPLLLDRVLIGWLGKIGRPVPDLRREDVTAVAELASRARIRSQPLFPDIERPDRVFLHRALEYVWAKRLLPEVAAWALTDDVEEATRDLLEQVSDERWVRFRYGQNRWRGPSGAEAGDRATERATRSSLAVSYELDGRHDDRLGRKLAEALWTRLNRRESSVLTSLVRGPNLTDPRSRAGAHAAAACSVTEGMRDALFRITQRSEDDLDETNVESEDGGWNWSGRAKAYDALIRALLRDDILLRMPLSEGDSVDETWAARLFHGFHTPFSAGAGGETLAHRAEAFLHELAQMSGKEREGFLRNAMNPKAQAVELVCGERDSKNRDAIFCGFNTPLLPDILVCTSVGQEGIDLHRECRHVIHYDLDWNPAKIEQRTGRTDRIGSKAERDRRLSRDSAGGDVDERRFPGLDIALPYLAATYDERIFDRLRHRAQEFAIVMGGETTADRDCPEDSATVVDDKVASFVAVPQEMLDDLKVNLRVLDEADE